MSELYDILVETPPTKVILLALDQGLWDCERSLAELSALCEANHMEAVAQVTQKRQTPETGTVLGSGKLEEASLAAETLGAECAVFDGELTGSQIRNISNALGGLEVIDRTMLILEIFRSRAVPVRPSWNWTAAMCMPASMRWLKSWPKWKSAGARAARPVPRPGCRWSAL